MICPDWCPVIVIGESLGATMALRVAAGHPESVSGVIISGPPARINPLMFFYPSNMWQGILAVLVSPRGHMKLTAFMTKLVSNNKLIGQEMLDDPLVAKKLTIFELLKTQAFCGKTVKYARGLAPDTPLLILQGSQDYCVVPDAIVKIAKKVRSADQTMRWLGNHGHLLLETNYIRAQTVNALVDWADEIDPAHKLELEAMQQLIRKLGGKSED